MEKLTVISLIALAILLTSIFWYASTNIPKSTPISTPTPTTTPQPTIAPTATPNLSSAISDVGNQYINVNFSESSLNLNGEIFSDLVLNVTNISKSNVTIITVTYVAKDGSNGTYPASGYQVLSPNSSGVTAWGTPTQLGSPPSLNSITVYYRVDNQLYYHTINT